VPGARYVLLNARYLHPVAGLVARGRVGSCSGLAPAVVSPLPIRGSVACGAGVLRSTDASIRLLDTGPEEPGRTRRRHEAGVSCASDKCRCSAWSCPSIARGASRSAARALAALRPLLTCRPSTCSSTTARPTTRTRARRMAEATLRPRRRLSRNFGSNAAILAGLATRARAVAVIAADLRTSEAPPELLDGGGRVPTWWSRPPSP